MTSPLRLYNCTIVQSWAGRGSVSVESISVDTFSPSPAPSPVPTRMPTPKPTTAPTAVPTSVPAPAPTNPPFPAPTPTPTAAPNPSLKKSPLPAPTLPPTAAPVPAPSASQSYPLVYDPAPTAAVVPVPTVTPPPPRPQPSSGAATATTPSPMRSDDEDGGPAVAFMIIGACALVAICGSAAFAGTVLARKMRSTSTNKTHLTNNNQVILVSAPVVMATMATAIDSKGAAVEMAPVRAVAFGSSPPKLAVPI